MTATNPPTILLKDYTVPDYLIQNVDLKFTLAEEKTQVISRLTLIRNPESQTGEGTGFSRRKLTVNARSA